MLCVGHIAALLYDVELDNLTGEEIELLSYWKKIDEEQKKAIITTMKAMTKS